MAAVDFYTICTNLTKYMLKDIHSGSSHMNVVGLIDKLTVVLLTFKSDKLPVTKCHQLFWCLAGLYMHQSVSPAELCMI